MQLNKILILSLCFLLPLFGCENDTEAEPKPQAEIPEETKQVYEPTEEEINSYTDTWIYQTGQNKDDFLYKLTLNEDMSADLPVLDGNGNLWDHSHGTWKITGENELTLSLTTTVNDSQELNEGDYFENGGIYKAVLTDDQGLELTAVKNADHIVSHMQFGPVTLYPEEIYFGSREEPLVRPEVTDEVLLQAAIDYYESATGHPYPGIAEIDSVSEDGILIHLYEDMETHTATAAWFLIDPATYRGTDDITGEEIDLTPFLPQ